MSKYLVCKLNKRSLYLSLKETKYTEDFDVRSSSITQRSRWLKAEVYQKESADGQIKK